MRRKNIILICLVAFVLATAGIAFAKAVKVILEPYAYAGEDPIEPDASGRAMLNHAKGKDKTEVQVNCWGLVAEAEYTVYLKPGGAWKAVGTFTADEEGEGHLHARLPGNESASLPVAVNNDQNKTVLLGP